MPAAAFAQVALDVPAAQLGARRFDYRIDPGRAAQYEPGRWVIVPWGRGRRVGLVVAIGDCAAVPEDRIRPIGEPLAGAPLADSAWLALLGFAADYYHRGIGELALPAMPRLLRSVPTTKSRGGSAFDRARERWPAGAPTAPARQQPAPLLNADQAAAIAALASSTGFEAWLLHGVTGSGKTEVYLRWIESVLVRDPQAQALLLVPEIALTPQLAAQVAARFPGEPVAVLHSELADGERAMHWLAAAEGRARLVIGTRLAILAPLPGLAAIVVDEEHDASYRQQEGVRYSARDLALVAASQRRIPVLLGSATPSLESWLAARRGRYRLLRLPGRIGEARLPALRVEDLRGKTLRHGLSPAAIEAIQASLSRGEQSLVFINRRGYAPVLACEACGWLSRCPNCSAWWVMHRQGEKSAGASRYRLVCHHCGAGQGVPRACPECGNPDLKALGSGTQRIEEGLAELFAGARIGRLDRDVARRRGAARQVIEAVHAGEVDLLVGTQMLAKGHDFRRLSRVIVLDGDAGLFSADYRAPERLFATLMQVSGRAGRDARDSEVIVQTRFPDHPLFGFLARHDFAGFADSQLDERRQVGLPPWRYQALLRAEASNLVPAIEFLGQARDLARRLLDAGVGGEGPPVMVLDPVPMAMSRLAGRERAQLLIECEARAPLHRLLQDWLAQLRPIAGSVQWALDVDPAEI
jgi:primosomal protein N' (replication factor Y) (superfamily II helicase)